MTRLWWIAVAVAVAAPARAQAPDPSRAHAEETAARAKAHFDRGEYTAAAADYRDAYRLWPSAGLLYNLAQADRLAGDCAHAALEYREYLRLQPDSPYRVTVEQNLSAADVCAKATPAPVAQPAPVLALALAPAPIADRDDGSTRRIAGLAIAGGGAVLAAAGTYFAVDASRAQHEVADFYAHGGDWSAIAGVDARGHRDHALAITGFALGGVALAAGATLYLLGRRDERAVAFVPARGGGEVVLAWTF